MRLLLSLRSHSFKHKWYTSLLVTVYFTEEALAPHSSTLAWKNPIDGGAWKPAVQGFTKSRTRLSNFTFTFHFRALEKEMATHSRVLAWRIPETGEPGGVYGVAQSWTRLKWLSSSSSSSRPLLNFHINSVVVPIFQMRKLRHRGEISSPKSHWQ